MTEYTTSLRVRCPWKITTREGPPNLLLVSRLGSSVLYPGLGCLPEGLPQTLFSNNGGRETNEVRMAKLASGTLRKPQHGAMVSHRKQIQEA